MRSLLLFLALFGFWLLLSGELDSHFLLASGILAAAVTTFICQRLPGSEKVLGEKVRIAAIPFYLPWLLYQVILANVDVIARVWNPSLPISPRLVKVPTYLSQPLALTLLANSITLTPGTVTVRVDDGELLVHTLDGKARKELLELPMEKRIQRMEIGARR